MESRESVIVIQISFPENEEELQEIVKVKIPAKYKEALDKLRLLTGRSKSESVTEGLRLFFQELNRGVR